MLTRYGSDIFSSSPFCGCRMPTIDAVKYFRRQAAITLHAAAF